MDFVTQDAQSQDCPRGVVVNMSLGGAVSTAVNAAAAAIIDAGLFLGVAAGNEAADASTSSPASEPSVCTVGATDMDDQLAEYSNFGKLVDILAPGTDIESTWPGNETVSPARHGGRCVATKQSWQNTISGTSMATPHITGLAAYLLSLGSVPTAPQELCQYIASTALMGAIAGVPNSTVNLLANNGNPAPNYTVIRHTPKPSPPVSLSMLLSSRKNSVGRGRRRRRLGANPFRERDLWSS
jgi:subtilisin family serine protease